MRILRVPEVTRKLGISRTTLWRWSRRPGFPVKLELGPQTVGWIEEEIDEWILRQRDRASGESWTGDNDL